MPSQKRLYLVLLVYLVTRVCYFFVATTANQLPINPFYSEVSSQKPWIISPIKWLDIWYRWDSNAYMDIINNGYYVAEDTKTIKSSIAFYPLYPFLIGSIAKLLGSQSIEGIFIIGLIFNQLCMVIGLFLLHSLTEKFTSIPIANYTLLFFSAYPHTFFYSSFEAYSLFFLLSTLFLTFASQKKYVGLAIAGFLAALTKHMGISLFISAVATLYSNKSKYSDWAFPLLWQLLIPAGTAIFFLYAYLNYGNFWLPVIAQQAWHRYVGINPNTLLDGHLSIFPYFDQIMIIVNLIGIYALHKKIRNLTMTSFGLAFSLLPLFTGTIHSYSRFSILNIPVFIGIGSLTKKAPLLGYVLVAILFYMQLYALSRWNSFYWTG